MSSIFDIAAADRSKAQQFPVPITKLELRENGGTSDQWVDYGDVFDCSLDITESSQEVSGGAKRQNAVMVSLKGNIVATGTNIHTALQYVRSYVVDVRATDINGHTYTFAENRTSGATGDLVVGHVVSTGPDGDKLIPFEYTGKLTYAAWLAAYATS